jgi:hypothetical protein
MKEYQLKKKIKDYFAKKGYIVWMPPRVRWLKEQDIFSIFDGIAWKEKEMIFFQITTIENKTARFKKIVNFMLDNNVKMPKGIECQLICWRKKKTNKKEKGFEVFKII